MGDLIAQFRDPKAIDAIAEKAEVDSERAQPLMDEYSKRLPKNTFWNARRYCKSAQGLSGLLRFLERRGPG